MLSVSVSVIGEVVCSGSIVYWSFMPLMPIAAGCVAYSVAGVMMPVVRSMLAPGCGTVMVAEAMDCSTTPVPAWISKHTCVAEWFSTIGTVTCEPSIS